MLSLALRSPRCPSLPGHSTNAIPETLRCQIPRGFTFSLLAPPPKAILGRFWTAVSCCRSRSYNCPGGVTDRSHSLDVRLAGRTRRVYRVSVSGRCLPLPFVLNSTFCSRNINYTLVSGIGMSLKFFGNLRSRSFTTLSVLLLYDFVPTLPDEVALIWRRKVSAASLIFMANRAAAILFVIFLLLPNVDVVSVPVTVSFICAPLNLFTQM